MAIQASAAPAQPTFTLLTLTGTRTTVDLTKNLTVSAVKKIAARSLAEGTSFNLVFDDRVLATGCCGTGKIQKEGVKDGSVVYVIARLRVPHQSIVLE